MSLIFLFQVLLCFSNGNHYDIVYPIKYKENSAMCQCEYHRRVCVGSYIPKLYIPNAKKSVLFHTKICRESWVSRSINTVKKTCLTRKKWS